MRTEQMTDAALAIATAAGPSETADRLLAGQDLTRSRIPSNLPLRPEAAAELVRRLPVDKALETAARFTDADTLERIYHAEDRVRVQRAILTRPDRPAHLDNDAIRRLTELRDLVPEQVEQLLRRADASTVVDVVATALTHGDTQLEARFRGHAAAVAAALTRLPFEPTYRPLVRWLVTHGAAGQLLLRLHAGWDPDDDTLRELAEELLAASVKLPSAEQHPQLARLLGLLEADRVLERLVRAPYGRWQMLRALLWQAGTGDEHATAQLRTVVRAAAGAEIGRDVLNAILEALPAAGANVRSSWAALAAQLLAQVQVRDQLPVSQLQRALALVTEATDGPLPECLQQVADDLEQLPADLFCDWYGRDAQAASQLVTTVEQVNRLVGPVTERHDAQRFLERAADIASDRPFDLTQPVLNAFGADYRTVSRFLPAVQAQIEQLTPTQLTAVLTMLHVRDQGKDGTTQMFFAEYAPHATERHLLAAVRTGAARQVTDLAAAGRFPAAAVTGALLTALWDCPDGRRLVTQQLRDNRQIDARFLKMASDHLPFGDSDTALIPPARGRLVAYLLDRRHLTQGELDMVLSLFATWTSTATALLDTAVLLAGEQEARPQLDTTAA